jgi:hypothetical protein
MSDKKKLVLTYTVEEYNELLKLIPKGVPVSRYIREKSLEQPHEIQSTLNHILDRVKELPLIKTKIETGHTNTLGLQKQMNDTLQAVADSMSKSKKGFFG